MPTIHRSDGMIFLPEQAAEYEKKRALVAQAPQMELFVMDERSAIDWLIDFLKKRPSTYQELHPEFILNSVLDGKNMRLGQN